MGGVKYVSPTVYDTIGCSHLSSYMKFVFAGWFISRHGLFEKVFSHRTCFEVCCVLAFAAYIVRHYLHHGTALYLMQPCLVYVIVTLFYRMKDRTNRAKNTLQQWGKNSLEIYSLHYFFIRTCSLPVVYAFTEGQNLEFVEIILAGVIAVVMCLVCVWWGRLINMSGVFGYLCFGNRTKQ